MSQYAGHQINANYPFGDRNGMLINITGDDIPSLLNNLEEFLEHVAVRLPDLRTSLEVVTTVGEVFPGTTSATSHAQQGPANQGQAAAGPAQRTGTETDKWGNTYEWGHPKAPLTPSGAPAVLKRGKSQQGNNYARWIDPRSKAIPSVYASGQKQDPPDVWPGDFAKGV